MQQNIKSVRDMGSYGEVEFKSPFQVGLEKVLTRFNYGIHHGRISRMGADVGHFIADSVRRVIPGHFGKVIGGLCAIPIVAPTELVSGFHNVFIKKEW